MPDMVEFAARKAIGTIAEMALRDLLIASGAIVTCNQINRDAVQDHAGAAIAHVADRTHHLPDLTAFWPDRPVAPTLHFEAKAKSPLGKTGGFGWDKTAFDRACRWAAMTRQPVIYAVRDCDAAPLPAPGEADDPHHWWFASTWKLLHAPTRVENGPCYYWGRDDFLPLPLLLEGQFNAALVPVFWTSNGPPIVL